MAYSDYGAFVWLNGMRRPDKEDVAAFATDEETFGKSSDDIPSGLRIWESLIKAKRDGKELNYITHIHHGILGDGNVRVICHKQGLPEIWEAREDGFWNVDWEKKSKIDHYEYDPIRVDYKGYQFEFRSGSPYYAKMVTPDGDVWECKYDYCYGAGF